ncbi:MAG: hypothetical protein RLY71_468 [Pseudomonadota bacterium]
MTNQPLAARTNAPAETNADHSIPIGETNVVERLQTVMNGDSIAAFGRRCGIPESNLRSYIKRGVKPGLDHLVAMADTAGVTVEWLATGRPPKLRRDLVDALKAHTAQAEPPVQPLDRARLAQAVQGVEDALQAAALSLPPDKRAELFCAAYDLIGQMGATAQARALLAQFVKLAR